MNHMSRQSFPENLPPVKTDYGPVHEQADPYSVRLHGGEPVYYALLERGGNGVLDVNDVRAAKQKLSVAIERNPDAVLSCRDKTRDEARKILEGLISS